jgi:hypothetical protein
MPQEVDTTGQIDGVILTASRPDLLGIAKRKKVNNNPAGFPAPTFCFIEALIRSFAVITTSANSALWHLGMSRKLPSFLCPPSCHGKQDFVDFDYHWGIRNLELHRISQLLDASISNFLRCSCGAPRSLRSLKRYGKLFHDQEVLVVENGCIDHADGYNLGRYIQAHVRQVLAARRRGIPVAAYIYWSITSHREWVLPFLPASDFGLYEIELDTDLTSPGRRQWVRRFTALGFTAFSTMTPRRSLKEKLTPSQGLAHH